MKNFTPRHLRKGANSSGKDKEKQKAFQRVKRMSDKFRFLNSKHLEGNEQYLEYCQKADRDGLRKGK